MMGKEPLEVTDYCEYKYWWEKLKGFLQKSLKSWRETEASRDPASETNLAIGLFMLVLIKMEELEKETE